ncbi:flagellar type III secretion system pore protein FliP [Brachyspira innocens]|uniref:Flagellar biosynthetic protein FliP n=1 Tax=Brachyspira innocens TaxID=13264 RepID=A0ABT8YUC8_9SPIR|nr:flagellar type III secretion system pore protein FliP [Brachyspira innocens]MDO6994031.1 flagellar type III secretion system pore protein FliP [Brachyspira innocens]MDO7019333.1 flagellar type III secretion system pore protein FliP [Brachyspira innocens]
MRKFLMVVLVLCLLIPAAAYAQDNTQIPIPTIGLNVTQAQTPQQVSLGLQILFLLTILSLSPSIIIMTTSFIRVSIVLSFVQRALSLQETPPRALIMGLSLFLTFFIMMPTLTQVNNEALQPYLNGSIGVNELYSIGIQPIRMFMFNSLRGENGMKSLDLFLSISDTNIRLRDIQTVDDLNRIPTIVVVPAFIINELTIAFKMGIYLFIPFIVIDLVVASILMAMGMIMLPPIMISLPLKIILFVAVDGWKLLILQIVQSFQ